MATIATLAVDLVANTKKFVLPSKQIQSFASDVKSAGLNIAGLASAITPLLAGAGIAALVKQQYEAVDATAKLADRLGATTEEIIALRHASDLAGPGAEAMDNALGKLTRTLGEAVGGSQTAAEAFNMLGLNVADLTQKSPAEAFMDIADAMESVANPAQKAALAVGIFGRDGANMVNVMRGGRKALQDAADDAQRLGLSINRIDAARIELANDAVTRLQALFVGAARTIAVELSPFVKYLADQFTDLGTSGGGTASIIRAGLETVLVFIAKVADWVELLKAAFYGLRGAIALALIGPLVPLGAAMKKLGQDVTFINALMAELAKTSTDGFNKMKEAFNRFSAGANEASVLETIRKIREENDKAAKAIADQAKTTRELLLPDMKDLEKVATRLMRGREVLRTDWFRRAKDKKTPVDAAASQPSGSQNPDYYLKQIAGEVKPAVDLLRKLVGMQQENPDIILQ